MGIFSSSKSWSSVARSDSYGFTRSRASQEIIARHAKQDKKAKKARAQRKADSKKFGRRGRGIVCG